MLGVSSWGRAADDGQGWQVQADIDVMYVCAPKSKCVRITAGVRSVSMQTV